MIIDDYLKKVVEINASDLHLSSGQVPMVRLDGDMEALGDYPTLTSEMVQNIMFEIMTDDQKKEYQATNDIDFAYELPGVARFRVNTFRHNSGAAAVLRTIPSKILTLEELKLAPIFKEICDKPRGLILVTGPTGSGKSTTLAAMIDYINTNRKEHILTIEDPIEFVHKNKKSLVSQREVHRDTNSFATALKASLREDPDIILVGEMRDLETIRLALTAAETGHLVFGTLHTTSAAKTIDRILDVFPAEEKEMVRAMLSESLQAVISQALLKKKGGGRVAAHEILIAIPAIRSMIRENKIPQIYSNIQTSSSFGMVTLDQSLKKLLADKIITKEDAKALAKQPDSMA